MNAVEKALRHIQQLISSRAPKPRKPAKRQAKAPRKGDQAKPRVGHCATFSVIDGTRCSMRSNHKGKCSWWARDNPPAATAGSKLAKQLTRLVTRPTPPEKCSRCDLSTDLPENEGCQIYVCERCGALVCTQCSEDGPKNTVFCLACAEPTPNPVDLVKLAAQQAVFTPPPTPPVEWSITADATKAVAPLPYDNEGGGYRLGAGLILPNGEVADDWRELQHA